MKLLQYLATAVGAGVTFYVLLAAIGGSGTAQFAVGFGAVIAVVAFLCFSLSRGDRERARRGVQPLSPASNEPVRHRVHPDDLRQLRP